MEVGFASSVQRYALCLALWVSSWVALPFVALAAAALLPAALRSALFFWPQLLLLPNGLIDRDTHATVLGPGTLYAAAVFWLVATALYIALTRSVRLHWVLIGFLPLVIVLLTAALGVLRALGVVPLLDGL